jgi:hypothetical protein
MEGHPEVVQILVQSHADVNVKVRVSTESPHLYHSLLIAAEIFVVEIFSLPYKAKKIIVTRIFNNYGLAQPLNLILIPVNISG